MRCLSLVSLAFISLLCSQRTSLASTFSFEFTPTQVDLGTSLKASGTFSISGNNYTDVTGTVYTADTAGTFIGSSIAGVDKADSPDYNPLNIVFAFFDSTGESYFINGPQNAILSNSDSIVEGRFSVALVPSVPLPPALPLFGAAILVLGIVRAGPRYRMSSEQPRQSGRM